MSIGLSETTHGVPGGAGRAEDARSGTSGPRRPGQLGPVSRVRARRRDLRAQSPHRARARSSRSRRRRSPASSCAPAATRTPSAGTCAWTPPCARSSSAPTTSSPPRRAASCWTIPRAKLAGIRTPAADLHRRLRPQLSAQLLGRRVPSERGFVGEVYRAGQAARADRLTAEDPLLVTVPPRSAGPPGGIDHRRAGHRRRIDLRRAAAGQPALGRALQRPGQRAAAHLRRLHVVARSRTRSTPSAPGRWPGWIT